MAKKHTKTISDSELIEKKVNAQEESPVYLKTSKRLAAAFLSILIIFVLGLLLDKFVVSPIVKNTTGSNTINETFKDYDKEYKSLQDHYEIYVYNEDKNRIPNENVSEENNIAFQTDPRVVELVSLMNDVEGQLLIRDLSIIGIDYLASTLIYALAGNFLFGVGRSFPAFVFHYELVDDNDKKLKAGKVFAYSFAKWFFNGILGVITLGILPLYNLYSLSHHKNYQCPIDRLCHVKYKIVNKYSSDK